MRWLMFQTRASEGAQLPAFVSPRPVVLMLISFWGQLSSIGDWSQIWKRNINPFRDRNHVVKFGQWGALRASNQTFENQLFSTEIAVRY